MSKYAIAVPVRLGVASGLAMMAALIFPSLASAASTLDQSQTQYMYGSGITFGHDTTWEAQTFTAGRSGILYQVDLNLRTPFGGYGQDVIVQIRSVDPTGAPSNVILASATVPAASITANPEWVSVPLTPGARSLAGARYAIVVGTAPPGPFHCVCYVWGDAFSDVYPKGDGYASSDAGLTWPSHSVNDAAFRTYVAQLSDVTNVTVGGRLQAV
jgi:hypothetical protein